MWMVFLVLNAVLGVAMFEMAWKYTAKHRLVDEARDSQFPAWRRNDAPKWTKYYFYPLAATVLPLRFLGFVAGFIFAVFFNKIALINHDLNQPIPAWKRMITRISITVGSLIVMVSTGIFVKIQRPNVDYSKYLGPHYKSEPVFYKRVSTYVSNHVGWPDALVILWSLLSDCSFLASDHVKNIPLVGYNVMASEGLFVPRGGTTEAREKTVLVLAERQAAIEEGRTSKSPLVIFPEGSTSNNTRIVKFKRGAFESLRSVIPISLQYGVPYVSPANELIADHFGLILACCCVMPIIC